MDRFLAGVWLLMIRVVLCDLEGVDENLMEWRRISFIIKDKLGHHIQILRIQRAQELQTGKRV